MYEQNQVPLPG